MNANGGDEYTIWVQGDVQETGVSRKLILHRRIWTAWEKRLFIDDEVKTPDSIPRNT
jgi:hypothetical protein